MKKFFASQYRTMEDAIKVLQYKIKALGEYMPKADLTPEGQQALYKLQNYMLSISKLSAGVSGWLDKFAAAQVKEGGNFNAILAKYFNEKQIQVIKDTLSHGGWGDCDMEFNDKQKIAWGACTNDAFNSGNYENRRSLSGIFSGIKRIIETTDAGNYLAMRSDWWGDGSGDMMFFAWMAMGYESLDEFLADN